MNDLGLSDEEEILFRQIHPSFIQGDDVSSQPFLPTSQAFHPTPKDDEKLSVDRGSMTTAQDSFALFTRNGHASAAVYGLSVAEFSREGIPCLPDPIEAVDDQEANPAHAVADYSAHKLNQQKNKAKRLKQSAIARGKLHP